MTSFWFGTELPSEFTNPVVNRCLSFNGQLHFRCLSCNEIAWVDVTIGRTLLERAASTEKLQQNSNQSSWFKRLFSRTVSKQGAKYSTALPCPNCQKNTLDVIRFSAIESRLCKECGAEYSSKAEAPFECAICKSDNYSVVKTIINPTYPTRLFAAFRKEPFGESSRDDIDFLIDYAVGRRTSPQFHRNCIHLVAFIESVFEYVYGSSEDATDLLNGASGLMRIVYKETGDLDAAFFSIALMMKGRNLSIDPIQRAVYGLNISQNIYSVLARRGDDILRIRFGFDLKEYSIWLSRQTLAAFEEIDEEWLAELRANQKWLLGDILKSGDPSEVQIDESLHWFDSALKDPALPLEVADFVRESAFAAQAKRRNLKVDEQHHLQSSLSQLAEKRLEETEGLQRISSFYELLRIAARSGQSQKWQNLALRCLGEAIIYTAANDPSNILRNSGTFLSRLASGFAAERFASGKPLEGIAGVEAFRSLAIEHGNVKTNIGHHVTELEIQLLISSLLDTGESKDPAKVARAMLAEHTKTLAINLKEVLQADPKRFIIWLEIFEELMLKAVITLNENELVVQATTCELDSNTMSSMLLPMAWDPPGRFRALRVQSALATGCGILNDELARPTDQSAIIVGASMLGAWPFDAAEAVHLDHVDTLRPMAFAPSITVASHTCKMQKDRQVTKVLVVSYGGDDLPGVRQEIEGIKDIYGTRRTALLEGDAIRRTELLEALTGKYEVIHFCGHGMFDYVKPMQSRLYFNKRSGSEGFITAAEILQCGTIGHDPVVVLSACSSAVVMPNGSNNFLGLAGALLRTGATSIVGARWPVSDSICAAFSIHLHARLSQGDSVDRGVAYAKSMLRDARIDEWAAFMSVGG